MADVLNTVDNERAAYPFALGIPNINSGELIYLHFDRATVADSYASLLAVKVERFVAVEWPVSEDQAAETPGWRRVSYFVK